MCVLGDGGDVDVGRVGAGVVVVGTGRDVYRDVRAHWGLERTK